MTHTQLPVMLDWEAEKLLEVEKDVVVVDVTSVKKDYYCIWTVGCCRSPILKRTKRRTFSKSSARGSG